MAKSSYFFLALILLCSKASHAQQPAAQVGFIGPRLVTWNTYTLSEPQRTLAIEDFLRQNLANDPSFEDTHQYTCGDRILNSPTNRLQISLGRRICHISTQVATSPYRTEQNFAGSTITHFGVQVAVKYCPIDSSLRTPREIIEHHECTVREINGREETGEDCRRHNPNPEGCPDGRYGE